MIWGGWAFLGHLHQAIFFHRRNMRLCSICHWKELLLSFKMSYLASKSRWAKFFKIFINTLILSSDDPKSRSIWGGAVIFKINFLSCYGVYSQTETIIVTRKPWRNFLGVALFQKKILKNLHRALKTLRPYSKEAKIFSNPRPYRRIIIICNSWKNNWEKNIENLKFWKTRICHTKTFTYKLNLIWFL